MANLSKTTQDHEEIRRWAEQRGGKPSHVKSTGSGEDVGILRIDFPGYSGAGSLEPIGWDEWFEKFDEGNLALLYEEETSGGERSNFNKIVSAQTAAANEGGRSRSGAKKSSRKAIKKSAPVKKAAKKASKKTVSKKTASKKKSVSKKSATKKAAKKATKAAKKSATRSSAKKKSASRAKKSSSKKRR